VLKQRFLTGILLGPLVLMAIFWLPTVGFLLFVGMILALGAWEWSRMSGLNSLAKQCSFAAIISGAYALIHFGLPADIKPKCLILASLGWLPALWLVLGYPKSQQWWQSTVIKLLLGGWVLLNFALAMSLLEDMSVSLLQASEAHLSYRSAAILSILLIIWSADVGAYFSGKAFGKHKLAPNVSPGKTWEGVIGGVIAACFMATGLFYGFDQVLPAEGKSLIWVLLLTVVITLVSVLGDLFESMFKRQAGFKDSSQLLPGHGGIMDRIDSLTAAAPLFVSSLWLSGYGA
jgi:phosphatidate cytidylyltransferase